MQTDRRMVAADGYRANGIDGRVSSKAPLWVRVPNQRLRESGPVLDKPSG